MSAAKTRIDSDWFYRRIAAREMSLREVARTIAMDPTALSRTLRGQRRLQMAEVEQLAATLGVGIEEVLRHAGLPSLAVGGGPAPADGQADRQANGQAGPAPNSVAMPQIGHLVGEDGVMSPLADPRDLPARPAADIRALLAARAMDRGRVALVSARAGPLALIDQALMVSPQWPCGGDETTAQPAPPEEGSLCLLRVDGTERVARFDRALKYGDASVILTAGETLLRPTSDILPVIAVLP